ncbi:ATP-dependent DNA helicase RecG [Pseudoflavonifractor phocaeensis]|uniref:ATP-dependent DNA helicase RecG n=1 Tax=Pseudoflavonifractor phocaeensis TaxID=1870988 RepID=UPI001957C157|nr:ATP-dependent DNA helicase RecG [Pseudoflavonifractor phocaeensis]MBM6870217.1 ATP-dependent DNA helicase RecG [Pseudoflavonifractor phocaeensis]
MGLTLESSVRALPGVGEARAKGLEKLGLATVGDLLTYYPRDYEDRRQICAIREAPEGRAVCIRAMVAETPRHSYIRTGLELTKVRAVDQWATLELTFFNQSYVKNSLEPGETYLFYGVAQGLGSRRTMTNPAFEREDRQRFTGRIMPIYPLTAGISNNLLAGLALRCVEECAQLLPETLPPKVRQDHALAAVEFSCKNIHFPTSEEALDLARRRLIFEELFYLACGLALLRERREVRPGRVLQPEPASDFLRALPFAPTGAQRRVMEEIMADLTSGRPMNRLVQGDVGSGKTMVAAFAAWQAAQNGIQSALMAPTELLAQQHLETMTGFLPGLRVALLTGSMKAAEKRKVKDALAGGTVDLVVGTHAVLSQGVGFANLGLVITDEQHRFGVEQRAQLAGKGERDGTPPHVLVMSATPIPRTLALIIYGDLDVSVIDELPPGRTPVETFLVGEDKRQRIYAFIRRQVESGRQVYIVCPAVEEHQDGAEDHPIRLGEKAGQPVSPPGFADLKAVTAYAKELQERVFPDLRVDFVHGKRKAKEKEAAMAAFAAGGTDILVATTVIEVGVDVPNANLILVENADRFGLSQLHQLRGRVGRGKWQSYCILMTANRNPETRARLKVLTQTTDGFRISEEDLKLRGPGDFFGKRQHGLPQLRMADLAGDTRLLREAQDAAKELLAEDPALERGENRPVLERVQALFTRHGDSMN